MYLDDILAHRTSFTEALKALRALLERMVGAGLKLHPEKCPFMRREVTFLGHRVGGRGISTEADKMEAVNSWRTTTSKQQVKSFLGLASYYRMFVSVFSAIADPLTGLLGKDREFCWTAECQQAFSSLKNSLGEAPVLTSPYMSLPFILDTDASNVGKAVAEVKQLGLLVCSETSLVGVSEWREKQAEGAPRAVTRPNSSSSQ